MQLYQEPVTTVNRTATILETTHQTANSLIQKLVDLKILKENTGTSRNRVFVFRRYLDLFMD